MSLSFSRSAFHPLYWAGPSTPGPAVGYLLPDGDTAGESLSLAETWTGHEGCYVFVDEGVPADEGAQQRLARRLRSLLADPGLKGTRFVWVPDPLADGPLRGPLIALDGPPDSAGLATVRRLARFPLRNVGFAIAPGCTVAPATDGSGFAIEPEANAGMYMTVETGATVLHVVKGGATLPLEGDRRGAFGFTVELGETGGARDLDLLDVGLRLFLPEEPAPEAEPAPAGEPVFLESLRYPLFVGPKVALAASIDPLEPLDEERTQLAFSGQDPLGSYLTTNIGKRVTLAPQPGSKLVFAVAPTDSVAGPLSPLYLAPAGPFGLGTEDAPQAELKLMCGLSGVEYLKLPAGGDSVIEFVPGQPAYVPKLESGSAPVALEALAKTSYVRVHQGTGAGAPVPLCAQPDSAVMHAPPTTPPADPASLKALDYLEVVAGPVSTEACFPLLPYDGVEGGRAMERRTLETTVIGPARRAAIAQKPATLALPPTVESNAPDVKAATAQGLLANFSPDMSTMKEVTLGHNADGSELQLQSVVAGTDLWTALQSNQLFLVGTDPAAFQGHLLGRLVAEQWGFDFEPSLWRKLEDSQPTFFVLKFSPKPLAELAGQLSAWTQPEKFNKDCSLAYAKLKRYIEESEARKGDPDFAFLVETVLQDPNWNGIVAFNCPTPIDGWPEQLQGLAAGIDPSQLVAHHAGVQATPVLRTNPVSGEPGLFAAPSSIFGLVYYESKEPIPAGPSSYEFKVTSLKMRIANSRVASFSSKVLLQVNYLFGEQTTLTSDPTANNLELDGSYQQLGGQASYVFLNQGENLFTFKQGAIDAMSVTRVQFVTVSEPPSTPPPPDAPPPPIRTRFLIWGTIDFKALPHFDLLSFGHESDEPGERGKVGLDFSGLAVDMTVQKPKPTDQMPAAHIFAFDARQISFGLGQSHPRSKSLYAALPVQLESFVETDSSSSPAELGYAPVTTPLAADQLGAPWFGLVLELELGTLGSFAPPGSFVARLLAAWSPSGGEEPHVFTGLKLPGMSGGQLAIPLEGPLQLTAKNVLLEAPEAGGGEDYVLWLQSIALSLFGLSFPMSGRTDLLLFAKPGDGGKRTIGWYAAYDKESGGSGGGAGSGAQPALSSTEGDR